MTSKRPAAAVAGNRWSTTPHWYLWEGGFLLTGRGVGIVPPHTHHAIQLVVALEGSFAIRGAHGDWRRAQGAIVRPDAVHSYDPGGALNAMLFVDPESTEGLGLVAPLRNDITLVPEERLADCAAELRRFLEQPFESLRIPDLVRKCVHAFCTGAPPSRRLDPRVTRVLAAIRASDDLRMSVDAAAAMAFLSPSRFAHLWKQQVGLPFRRYLLWRKLTRAMLMIGRGRTTATAAHEADFADAAHLTHTFHRMVGIAPSVLMSGEFFEIASPFEA
ncbi:MAG: helix-turn-helix transcriptional regulator [Thermoanaerobaculia bacterium]|nr:helix-turn-helix transcriptional regulator [Thermoanaerobaculia bacterium]MBP9823717.1 helix-turn-helix transcriptional regulator [Thermoanaerobaculia bacterium]